MENMLKETQPIRERVMRWLEKIDLENTRTEMPTVSDFYFVNFDWEERSHCLVSLLKRQLYSFIPRTVIQDWNTLQQQTTHSKQLKTTAQQKFQNAY